MDPVKLRWALTWALVGFGSAKLVDYVREYLKSKAAAVEDPAELSTTSSAHTGAVYETQKAVSEYLQFHFGSDTEILPYTFGPINSLNFAVRTAELCIRHCERANVPLTAALDVGCAVGRTSFELSRVFQHVVGIDFSHAFVDAANSLKSGEALQYDYVQQGAIQSSSYATAPASAHPERITFQHGDACHLDLRELGGRRFNVIHAANLLCRLPSPRAFLSSLPSIIARGGLVVLVSPYSWLSQYTPRSEWIGATVDPVTKQPRYSSAVLQEIMTSLGFVCIHSEDVPFLIREHSRKYQWGVSEAQIWKYVAAENGVAGSAGAGGVSV